MLRENADVYADPEKPSGCMVVLGTATWTPHNQDVRSYLTDLRQKTLRADPAPPRARVPRGIDVDAVAGYYNTVLEGLSIQARDGASRESMHAIVDCAMAAWDALVPAA
jgi:hypothetical protein